MLWLGGRIGKRADKLDLVRKAWGAPQNNLNYRGSLKVLKTCNWESWIFIYNNLKFAFEAAKYIRFSHSNLFWGALFAAILPSFPLPQHVSDL